MEFLEATIHEQIKRVAAYRGMNLTALKDAYNARCGKQYTQQGFSRKLIRGSIRWDELKEIGEILGFDVKIILRDEKNKTGQ